MLNINLDRNSRYCDGISRRSMLQLGAMGLGGLTLASLFRAEAAAGVGSSNKAIINIHLGGGPSHQDMFDLKPEAPREFRGEFNPIATNVPGIEICEHMPLLAKMADKFAVIRSLIGMYDDHSNFHTQTGFGRNDLRNIGGRPSIGSVVSKVLGPTGSGAPCYVAYNDGPEGYLGPVHKPYHPQGGDLRLVGGMDESRLSNRTNLLSSLDKIRRNVDASRKMEALDSFTQRAVGVVTSGKVADALDLEKEDKEVRERYGRNDGDSFLRARRLVEAGVRVVTFDWGGWDTHGDNFNQLRRQLPKLDQAMSALLTDLSDRGLDKDVTVVMWGEFGRTPRVNGSDGGRDHWAPAMSALVAGGGLKMGQAIGTTNPRGEVPADRPYTPSQLLATLYRAIGIDPALTFPNANGRPMYVLDDRDPVVELL